MTKEEAIQLQKENQELREALKQTQELLRVALARIEELEKLKTPPPAFVKADVPKPAAEEKKPCKKREVQHNRARRRAMPPQIVEHHLAIMDPRIRFIHTFRAHQERISYGLQKPAS